MTDSNKDKNKNQPSDEDDYIKAEQGETDEEREERLEKLAKGKGDQLQSVGKGSRSENTQADEDITEEEASKLPESQIDPTRVIKERAMIDQGDFESLRSPDVTALLSEEEFKAEQETNTAIRSKFLVEQSKNPLYHIWVINGHDAESGKDNAIRKPYKYHALTVKQRKDYLKMKAKAADLDKKRAIPVLLQTPELQARDLHSEFVDADYDFVQMGVDFYFHMSRQEFENCKFVDARDCLMAAEYREMKVPLRNPS